MNIVTRGLHLTGVGIILTTTLGMVLLEGQETEQSSVSLPQTPWGDPDLQGIWDSKSTTLMERPEQHADREFLTDEEIAALEAAREREASQGP